MERLNRKTKNPSSCLALLAVAGFVKQPIPSADTPPAATPPAAPSPPERKFAAGDVVEIDKAGLECFEKDAALDDLIEAISTERKAWPKRLFGVCTALDEKTPYEIMKVSDGIPPYNHVYCVNDVVDFPTNKTGCVWAIFPIGRAHLSSCKPGPALTAGTVVPPFPPVEFDTTERVPALLPCQGHYLD